MRLAIFSDIHGNQTAFETVLRDLKAAGGADKTWILGDLVAFGPRPAECMAMVRDLKDAKIIRGNTDRYVFNGDRPQVGEIKDEAAWLARIEMVPKRDANYNWAAALLGYKDFEVFTKARQELDLEVEGYGWVIGYHGTPGSDEVLMWPDTPEDEVLDQFMDREGRLGFGGHTHTPMDRELGRWRVVNVGSVGLPKDEPRACYVIATFEGNTATLDFRRVEYDAESVVRDLEQRGHPNWQTIAESIKR